MLTNCGAELPNPHAKQIREILNSLAIYDNEYQRISIELRDAQKEFKQSVDNVIFQCSELRKLACASEERIDEFHKNVENIDAVTERFNKRIEGLQNKRQHIFEESKKCFDQLDIGKTELSKFHHRTINYLKAYAVQSSDPVVVGNCEKDVNEINKQFAKEVHYIKKCESVMGPYFQLLHDCKSHLQHSYHFSEYTWLPQGKSMQIVNSIAKEIKDSMGVTLRKVFANLHIHQPRDRGSFIAQYLMTLERNEEIIKEKLERFTSL